jgi:hydroxymethylglutaryl-CoA lyase
VTALPARVRIFEVGPRDGLQNEARPVTLDAKADLVERLADAGLVDIEVSSFVRPDLVPQLADAAELFGRLSRRDGVRYWALVPNERGLERARECGVGHVAVFTAATDGFSRANTNASVEESLARLKPVVRAAAEASIPVRGYVSTAFACPYDGPVAPEQPARVARTLLDFGCGEVSLGDTIGVAVPTGVRRVLEACDVLGVPREAIALHFHDTSGTALANVYAGLQEGIAVFDASAGGLGGCPFAPGATGNLATEDLQYLLEGLGIETGIDLGKVAVSTDRVAAELGREPPSRARAAWKARVRR